VATPATALPLTVAEAKAHLRIEQDAEDPKLEEAIEVAVDEIASPNGWLGRSIMPQTLRLTLDAYPPRVLYLPGPPVTEVKTIKVREDDDTFTTIYDADAPTDTINLQSDLTAVPPYIWPDDDIGWPGDIKYGPDSMQVEYIAGYATADDVPKVIQRWLLMRVGELYRDPEASLLGVKVERLSHADRMLDGWRVRR